MQAESRVVTSIGLKFWVYIYAALIYSLFSKANLIPCRTHKIILDPLWVSAQKRSLSVSIFPFRVFIIAQSHKNYTPMAYVLGTPFHRSLYHL